MTTDRPHVRLALRAGFAAIAAALALPGAASAHFLWIKAQPASGATASSPNIRAFLNETPEPAGPEFLKSIRDVTISVDGRPLPISKGAETIDARWAGKLPTAIDAECDLGVKAKDGKSYRLFYTARAQTGPIAAADKEKAESEPTSLRVRVVTRDGKPFARVSLDGKPAANARIKLYPADAEPTEIQADAEGYAEVPGLAEGKTALWANVVDPRAGESAGKAFAETRHYATLTYLPSPVESAGNTEVPTAFGAMPGAGVNSFGGAVANGWLYVYSGHIGKTHEYNVDTTSRHFRRMNLETLAWEDLPMARDVQGVALVSDGRSIYRVGGMSARNAVGAEHDLHSTADFARFDPETKAWTDLAPLPVARSTHDAVIVGRTVYALGGWTMKGDTEESVYLADAAAFDLDHPEAGWKTIPQPFRRRALAAAEHGGKIYVLGGLDDGFKVRRQVDVYDPSTKAWSLAPELPGTGKNDGFAASAFGVDGQLYHSGGSGRIYRLSPRGDAWQPLGAWYLPRITHRLLPGPSGSLIAVGGNTSGHQTPIIERLSFPSAPISTEAGGD